MAFFSQASQLIQQLGGPIVACLILLSTVALAIIIARLIQSARSKTGQTYTPQELIDELKRHGKTDHAVSPRTSPRIDNILDTWEARQNTPSDDLRNEAIRRLRNRVDALSSGLRPLEVIATVSPLLGLFGTVLGMIEAFKAMEAAGAQVDPAVLSGGIWQALLTTAVGLGVAIPVSLIHSAMERGHEKLANAMLSDSEQLLHITSINEAQHIALKAVRG